MSSGTERKRAWRLKAANREAENKLRNERGRAYRNTEQGRLNEAVQDTIRMLNRKLER